MYPECIKNKCMGNSMCIPDSSNNDGYRCECDSDHDGVFCEKKKDKCKDVTCTNNGYCVNGTCMCDPKIPLCRSDCMDKNVKCQNGGKCIDLLVSGTHIEAKCLCPPGLTVHLVFEQIYNISFIHFLK